MIEFLAQTYIYFIIGGLVLIVFGSIVGWLADLYSDFKNRKANDSLTK